VKITFSFFLPVVSSEPAHIALHTLASAVPVKAWRGNKAANAAALPRASWWSLALKLALELTIIMSLMAQKERSNTQVTGQLVT